MSYQKDQPKKDLADVVPTLNANEEFIVAGKKRQQGQKK